MDRSIRTRRDFLKTIGLAAASLAVPAGRTNAKAGETTARARKPNVLFLFTDDQREDTIAALGNPHIRTPNLDKLAKSGVVFTNAYCMGGFSGAVCLPSRMMLLRGRSWFSVRNLPKDAPNFPKSINEAGYVSYHHGKRGNTARSVHPFFTYSHYLGDGAVRLSGHPGEVVANDATRFLRERKKGKPFFMYLAFASPHDPRVAPEEYLAKYDIERIPVPPNFKPFHPFNNGELLIRDEQLAPWPRTKAVIRKHLRDYYADITYLDEQIGRIIRTLKDLGEYENTIIIFSSDQGIAIGSHGLMGKQNLYEDSMGVPLIFCGPGIPKGKSSDALAYLFDVYPTVCELVGAKVPASLEGKSLAPVIQGKTNKVRDTVFLAYKNLQRAVRRGRWKLLRYPQINRTQLFDLRKDPDETKDLADDPAYAGKVKELLAVMTEQQKLFGDSQPLTSDNPQPAKVNLEFFKKPSAAKKRKGKQNKTQKKNI